MKSLKTLQFTKCVIAAAMAAGGITGSQAALVPIDVTPNSPDNGVVCISGYAPAFNGNSLTCSKTKTDEIKVNLVCLEAPFTHYAARAVGSLGSPAGLDVCAKVRPDGTFVDISVDSDLTKLTKGKDYVFAKPDTPKINEKIASNRQAEATALGLSLGEVDVHASDPVTDTASGDSFDKSKVTTTYFTFAGPPPLFKVTGGSFVPRPLR